MCSYQINKAYISHDIHAHAYIIDKCAGDQYQTQILKKEKKKSWHVNDNFMHT